MAEENIKTNPADETDAAAEPIAGKESTEAAGTECCQEAEEGDTEQDTLDEAGNASDEDAQDEKADAPKEKKGFFGKKKEKKDKKDVQIEELTDRLKRQMAEFDNYRKRTEKEKSAMFEVGAKSVIEKMLPVIDNFERGLATLSEEERTAPFAEGMDKIYKQLLASLEEIGVKAIEAKGQEFDPNFHNAVMHVDDENFGENIVAEEFQKGYTYRDSVVRHSMVKVAN